MEESGSVSAELVAVWVIVVALIAAIISMALPDQVDTTAQEVADCLFSTDTQQCDLPPSTSTPGDPPDTTPTDPSDSAPTNPTDPDPSPEVELPPVEEPDDGILPDLPGLPDVDLPFDPPDLPGPNDIEEALIERILKMLAGHVGEIATMADEIVSYYRNVGPSVDELFPDTLTPRSDRLALAIAYTLVDEGSRVVECGTSGEGTPVLCVEGAAKAVPEDADAFTLGHVLFCKTVCEDGLLDHELVHVEQFEKYGDSFVLRYIAESAKNGTTCDNKYEVPAYEENKPCPHDH